MDILDRQLHIQYAREYNYFFYIFIYQLQFVKYKMLTLCSILWSKDIKAQLNKLISNLFAFLLNWFIVKISHECIFVFFTERWKNRELIAFGGEKTRHYIFAPSLHILKYHLVNLKRKYIQINVRSFEAYIHTYMCAE